MGAFLAAVGFAVFCIAFESGWPGLRFIEAGLCAAWWWRRCMSSLIPSLAFLGLAAVAALWLAKSRRSPSRLAEARISASRWLGLATAVQGAHFAEEWATQFQTGFPALFGLEPVPSSIFVAFNLAWISVWIVSIPFLRAGHPAAFFAAWFLAIAGTLNGVAHPLMAIASGGYFPGLISSPFIGLASIGLWYRLRSATGSGPRPR